MKHVPVQLASGGTVAVAWAALLGVIPNAAAWSFGLLGQGLVGLGAAMTAVSLWFRQASDEGHERAVWGAIGLAALLLAGYAAWRGLTGIPTAVWIVALIILAVAGLNYVLKEAQD